MAIAYKFVDQRSVRVYIGKDRVGTIKPVSTGGWRYVPKGSKTGGEVFNTIAEVKRSLETDFR